MAHSCLHDPHDYFAKSGENPSAEDLLLSFLVEWPTLFRAASKLAVVSSAWAGRATQHCELMSSDDDQLRSDTTRAAGTRCGNRRCSYSRTALPRSRASGGRAERRRGAGAS